MNNQSNNNFVSFYRYFVNKTVSTEKEQRTETIFGFVWKISLYYKLIKWKVQWKVLVRHKHAKGCKNSLKTINYNKSEESQSKL